MAIFHVATSSPTKAELIQEWAPTQSWGPSAEPALVSIGSFHFDDPGGQVGMETHLVEAEGATWQIPVTYRDSPDEAIPDALVGTLEHSALGTRWVYDGLADDLYVTMLAAISLTGQGQALGMATYEGRWYAAPTAVRLHGGGWAPKPVAIDGFTMISNNVDVVEFANDRFDLTVYRRPQPGEQPAIGLTATTEQRSDRLILTELRERER